MFTFQWPLEAFCKHYFTIKGVSKESKYTYILLVKIKEVKDDYKRI